MSTNYRLHIDPADVLGVSRESTLQEIRDAYRAKAKRYHPDAGGEDWAFRILTQSYEILSTARVASASEREQQAPPRPSWARAQPQPPPRDEPSARPFRTEPPRAPNRPRPDAHESVRPGVSEASDDPAKVVEVEKVSIRFEAEHVWLITDRSRDDRFLSCSLNITWPDPDSNLASGSIPNAEATLKNLERVFEALCAETKPLTSHSSVEVGQFSAWLSFPNDERAQAAFGTFRHLVHTVGLVVKQWSRDLVIPRQWR